MNTLVTDSAMLRPLDYILLKVSAQCNLRCTYCYWFKDADVLKQPPTMTEEVEAAFLKRLEQHIVENKLSKFMVLYHGGEPLLIGKKRFVRISAGLYEIERSTGCQMTLAITTNGVLVDKEWAEIFKVFNVSVTISVDGPKALHDSRRVTLGRRGTYDSVMKAVNVLRSANIDLGFLSVANPDANPKEIYQFFKHVLQSKHFDILMPDGNHDSDSLKSISRFYIDLFDAWYDDQERGQLRLFENMIRGLLGLHSTGESIGFGPIATTTLLPNGDLEPLDVLRIAGSKETKSSKNILRDKLDSIRSDDRWQAVLQESVSLPEKCSSCPLSHACGGAFLPTRYSSKNGYDNPSVYCEDLISIFNHIWNRIRIDLALETEQGSFKLFEERSA